MAIARIELATDNAAHGTRVYILPKSLDENVAPLHLDEFGVRPPTQADELAKYVGVPIDGPYWPEQCRH